MTLLSGEQKLETIGSICLNLPQSLFENQFVVFVDRVSVHWQTSAWFRKLRPAFCLNWLRLCIDTVYFHFKAPANILNVWWQLARIVRIYLLSSCDCICVFGFVPTAIEIVFFVRAFASKTILWLYIWIVGIWFFYSAWYWVSWLSV